MRPDTMHGTLLSIFDHGVLLKGPSASGKSDLALQLLDRGHALVADDALLLSHNGDHLIGTCPPALQNLLEIRALGIVDVRQLYGANAVRSAQRLDLVIELQHAISDEEKRRRRPNIEIVNKDIMGVVVKHLNLPLALSVNVAILVESAVRLTLAPQKPFIEQLLIEENI